LGFCFGATGASASPYNAIWFAFQDRCLTPFEAFADPIVDDLVPVAGQDGAFQLQNGAVLIVSGDDAMGSRSCAVQGPGLIKGYREWVAQSLQTGLYRESDTPGLWMSHEWIEPRIAIEKTKGAIRVVETFLES
jgi:hypothetical protein